MREADPRKDQLAAEIRVRNTFQSRWPAQHALAWIITGSDNAIDQIDDLHNLWHKTSWEVLSEIADAYRNDGETREQVLWNAFDRLATALGQGQIAAWRSTAPFVNLSKVDPDAFGAAGMMLNTNSCGLFGARFGGNDASDFVLMWPDYVRRAFPPAETGTQSVGAPQSTSPPAQPRRTRYDWARLEAAATVRLEDEGGFFPTWSQADLEREMTAWADKHWDRTPGESTIREHVATAFKRFKIAKASME